MDLADQPKSASAILMLFRWRIVEDQRNIVDRRAQAILILPIWMISRHTHHHHINTAEMLVSQIIHIRQSNMADMEGWRDPLYPPNLM